MLAPPGYKLEKYDNYVVFYRLEINELNVPEVKDCVGIDRDLYVKLFYIGAPLPLPQWFCDEKDCSFMRKSMMQNFPNYIKWEGEQTFNILKEFKELKFKKKRMF